MPSTPATCPACGETKKSFAGMQSHARAKHNLEVSKADVVTEGLTPEQVAENAEHAPMVARQAADEAVEIPDPEDDHSVEDALAAAGILLEPVPEPEIMAPPETSPLADAAAAATHVPDGVPAEIQAEAREAIANDPGEPVAPLPNLEQRTSEALNKVFGSSVGRSWHRVGRTYKMAKPICNQCRTESGDQFYLTCPHNPYFSVRYAAPPAAVKQREDGSFYLEQSDDLQELIAPNLRQVAAEPKMSSGRGVAWALEHGYKRLPELGIAEMCMYLGCWSTNLTVRTGYGQYCDVREAKLVSARLRGRSLPIPQHPQFWEIVEGLPV